MSVHPGYWRRVEVVLGATCGEGTGPRLPVGGLYAATREGAAHQVEHPAHVDGCTGCAARRAGVPFGGRGPGGPACYGWRDSAGGWEWTDGTPPAPAGVLCDARWRPLDGRR